MSDSYSNELLSDISENSFVILGPGSLQIEDKVGLEDVSNSEDLISSKGRTCSWDSAKSINDSKCSCSEGSIQEKFDELVKENYQLKETLSQNNLAIKSQLDTFLMWQQEVLKTHENHKQTFLETKDLILKLQIENLSLKKQLEEFSLLNISSIPDQENKASEDSDRLEGKIKELQNIYDECANKNKNLTTRNQELVEELAAAKGEILNLKEELEDVSVKLLKQWGEYSEESQSSAAQASDLLKQLEAEKSKVLELEEVLKKMKSSNKEASDPVKSATDQINQCIGKLNDADNMLVLEKPNISSIQSWVATMEDILQKNQNEEKAYYTTMNEIKMLKSYLNMLNENFEDRRKDVQGMKEQFVNLLKNFETDEKQLISPSGPENIDKLKKEIISLSAELQTKNEELRSKEKECNDLKEELQKSNAEFHEKDTVLKIQADIYQSDFHIEREAREQILEEKEKLAEQIRLLQSQLENIHKNNTQTNGCEGSSLERPKEKEFFQCPQCLISFPDLESCEKHVDDCLDTLVYQ